jgi:hypothetical protein
MLKFFWNQSECELVASTDSAPRFHTCAAAVVPIRAVPFVAPIAAVT